MGRIHAVLVCPQRGIGVCTISVNGKAVDSRSLHLNDITVAGGSVVGIRTGLNSRFQQVRTVFLSQCSIIIEFAILHLDRSGEILICILVIDQNGLSAGLEFAVGKGNIRRTVGPHTQ